MLEWKAADDELLWSNVFLFLSPGPPYQLKAGLIGIIVCQSVVPHLETCNRARPLKETGIVSGSEHCKSQGSQALLLNSYGTWQH